MLFMVWSDTGDRLRAYCVPDSYTGYSNLDIYVDGTHRCTMAPNDFNEHTVGRHADGMVGFDITTALVDDLAICEQLELRDHETGLLVYRRARDLAQVEGSYFRLETSLLPAISIDRIFKSHFRYWYNRIDRHSAETARQILSFHCYKSLYASGRLMLEPFSYYLDGHQKIAMLVQEPFQELAERIIVASLLKEKLLESLNDREKLMFAPFVEVFSEKRPLDEKSIKSALSKLSSSDANVLNNPVCRQLTTKTPDELPRVGALSKALTLSADFAIVGVREETASFVEALANLVGVGHEGFEPPPKLPYLDEVAEIVKSIKWIYDLLGVDLEFYDCVHKITKKYSEV